MIAAQNVKIHVGVCPANGDISIKVAMPEGKAIVEWIAQASSHVVCQGWEGSARIVRIVRDGGRCFKETISPYQGHVAARTEVPCNASCPTSKSK